MGIYVFKSKAVPLSTLVPRDFQAVSFSLPFQFLMLQLNPHAFLLLVTDTRHSVGSGGWQGHFHMNVKIIFRRDVERVRPPGFNPSAAFKKKKCIYVESITDD